MAAASRPQLERKNALKKLAPEGNLRQLSSFRIRGATSAEAELIYRQAGLTSLEDLAISREEYDTFIRGRSNSVPSTPLQGPLEIAAEAAGPGSVGEGDAAEGDDKPAIGEEEFHPESPPVEVDVGASAPAEEGTGTSSGEGNSEQLGNGDDLQSLINTAGWNSVPQTPMTARSSRSNIFSPSTSQSPSLHERPKRRPIDNFIKGKELGRGSFGIVYEAINSDGTFFAVKEVSLSDQGANAKQCIDQLKHEILLLSRWHHENIVEYLGSDSEDTKLYIFLELATQGSLAKLYDTYKLRESQVSAYTRQLLSGLNYLHQMNVVHRDIKCGNVLVDANGSVKLADFGLAKELDKMNQTKSSPKGSFYWMAPEVIKGRGYGPSADIWSLGCTVLEMFTGNVPYPDLDPPQALYQIGQGVLPPIPSSLSEESRDFILKCLQINPGDRPSAQELLQHPFVNRRQSYDDDSVRSGSSNGSNHHPHRPNSTETCELC